METASKSPTVWEVFSPISGYVFRTYPGWFPRWVVELTTPWYLDFELVQR